jgi:dolichol-phosphate mannosyltransferase
MLLEIISLGRKQMAEAVGKMDKCKLSLVIPCYNEEATLADCIDKVREIAMDDLDLELIIVDDCSSDNSLAIARELEKKFAEIVVYHHEKNQGKGAALRTGFQHATGDFVGVQDADLEYDPMDLRRLVKPLREGKADVVYGSRYLSHGTHRVLYFWHTMGNKFLTMLSNMFTDLNLTDMETCYKIFKREVIQSIDIKENRFGFEPEITAKVAQKRLRIFEMGISYIGRTYEEGKKIGASDGFRALYCIFHYNAPKAPVPIQFLIYLVIGGLSGLLNLGIFLGMYPDHADLTTSALTAYFIAGAVNYILCIFLLFRHKAKWNFITELLVYGVIVGLASLLDLWSTQWLLSSGMSAGWSKALAALAVLIFNFVGRRFLVFPEKPSGPWKPMKG